MSRLENLIDEFSTQNLILFLRKALEGNNFKPSNEDLDHLFPEDIYDKYDSIVKIGEAEIDKNDLIVIASKTTEPLTERTGKKNQYEIAKTILKHEVKDASLFVFYDEEGNFRFSFVKANYLGTKRDFTDFKRYTYFVTPSQTNKTYIKQVGGCNFNSLDEIIQAFSVEPLNKQFYQDIAKSFYGLIGGKVKIGSRNVEFDTALKLPSTPVETNRKIYQEFAVRLIGRTIFCWFLKSKKSENSIPLVPESWLSSKTVVQTNNEQHNYYHSVLEKLFFLVLNKKQADRKDYELPTDQELIPFLNGGLFEAQADDFFPTNSKGIHQIAFDLKIPNQWFIELFEVLEQYNFTIDENSIYDAEVSIDPEMLGTIFENLLAEIDPDTEKSARKATGSFYTPREVVDYMVEQSLVQYLKTKVSTENEEQLLELFKEGGKNKFEPNETATILEALSDVKILDPACGSGAFPMGALHKIIIALQKLDPDATWWKQKQIDNANNAIVKQYLKEKFDKSNSDYARKLGVIQNSIYGVDIQPIASEISKLRSFLSLVIDENIDDKADNRGIWPLPNLEFKFVTANTLIGLEAKDISVMDFGQTDVLQDELKTIRNQYLQAYGEEKNQLKKDFDNVQTKILKQEIAGGGHNKRALQLASWKPFSNESNNWFDPYWMYGVDKFDIVIGNPPYVQVKKGVYSSRIFPYSEGKDKGKQNLYKLFVEQSYNLSKMKGVACMIVQSSLLCDLSSTFTRELLIDNTEITQIIEFPKKAKDSKNQVFKTVLQGTCVYVFNKVIPSKNFETAISIENNVSTVSNLEFEFLNQFSIKTIYPETFYIPLIKMGDAEILEKLKSGSDVLKTYIKSLNQGDLNLTSSVEHFSENKAKVKLYRGRNVQRFLLLTSVEEYVDETFKSDIVKANSQEIFIVLQEITGTTDKHRIHACFTEKNEGYLFGHTANKILLADKDLNKVILSILNSKLMDWLFRKTSTNNHVMGYEIEQFPIIIPKKETLLNINNLVDEIIQNKLLAEKTNYLELKLDILVYKLYNLEIQEVKIIDPEINLTEEEYTNYQIN